MWGRGQGLNWKLQLKEFRGKWGGFLTTVKNPQENTSLLIIRFERKI